METTQSEQAKLVRKKEIKLKNLEEKLEGKLPITRNELIYLINSHGRNRDFYLRDDNQKQIIVKQCEPKECYDLSKLDTSEITDMSRVFQQSLISSCDISNWNTSNVTNMDNLFYCAKYFNENINNWDVSNVTSMYFMFGYADNYNQPLNNWNTTNLINIE